MKSNYRVEPLSNYITQIRGISYKPTDISEEEIENYKVVLRANSIQDNKLVLNDLIYVKDSLIKEIQIIKENDILMAASSGSKEIVGKTVQITKDMNCSFGAFCKLIRCKDNINPRYVGYFFRTPYYRTTISSIVCGANINNIKNEHIDNLLLPVVDKGNQQKIVEILDKAQELIDKRKEQIEALDELIKSQFIQMFGDPINNPMGWEVKKLKNISTKILSGNTPKGGSEVYVDDGIMFFRSQNVWKNKLILDDIAYIDEKTHQKMMKSSLKHRDILITKTGRINTENSSLGRAALYLGEDDKAELF